MFYDLFVYFGVKVFVLVFEAEELGI